MISMKFSIVAGAMLLGVSSSFGQGMAYGVDGQNKLWLADLSDASSTLIGDLDFTATSLGVDSSGRLFAGRSNGLL